MADGTKAIVDASVADEAALAMAIEDIASAEATARTDGDPAGGEASAPGTTDTDTDTATDDALHDGPQEASQPPATTAGAREADEAPQAAAAAVEKAVTAREDGPHHPDEATGGPGSATADGPTGPTPDDSTPADSADSTAQLSAKEIAAELAARSGAPATPARRSSRSSSRPRITPAPAATGRPAVSTETLEADTGTLPAALPAPLHHSGDKIGGRYRLEECTTQSETFSSWRAVDEKLRRAVGVHLMAAGHRRAKAVLTAARSAALLGDPRFVQVLDAVQEGDLVYVVREWLPGASDLAHLLADGPMEPHDAYQMVRQVTDAVAAAHRRGQAHLRLTPRCVLRTDSGQYRINGIAVDAALRGLPADDAELADTRAIGALLFAALTHRWPYPEDRYDLRGMPKDLGCVPPDQVRAGVHKGLSELAARTLCTNPPHHQPPITTPEELAKAIALMPRIRQPEAPAPTFAAPKPKPSAPHPGRPVAAPPGPNQRPGGPATHQAAPAAPRPPRRRRRLLHTSLRVTASLVALAAIVVGSWQTVEHLNKHDRQDTSGQPSGTSSRTPSSRPSSAPLAGVTLPYTPTSFNAFGTEKAEHASRLDNVDDGRSDTTWSTQGYHDPLGEYRPGTGLLLDLGTVRTVGFVDVELVGGNHTVELRTAPAGAGTPAVSPSGFATLGGPVAKGSGTSVQLKPEKPVTTRYLLIWLTAIPNDGQDYRGEISEITVTA